MKTKLLSIAALLAAIPLIHAVVAQDPKAATQDGFRQMRRPGSVDLEKEYNLANLNIPQDQIHTLLPRDSIPALTDPKLESVAKATWLSDDARIIAVTVGKETVGVPLGVLDWHEIVNITIGGEPIAVTYCPLCDSATVFSRRVTPADGGEPVVLEFGVSGALFNSNVLMYDQRDKGLWSQLGMRAVSGPLAGTSLDMLPVRLVSVGAFRETHAGASIVSRETGHQRAYGMSPYGSYFADEQLMVPVAQMGNALARKTLGLGVAVGERAWFVPIDVIGERFTLQTPAGAVHARRTEAGVAVEEAPATVRTAQTFYYSWSAFFPRTEVIRGNADSAAAAAPGLPVGAKEPGAALLDIHGKPVDLAGLYKDGPVVVTFYRGGWRPFCNRALAGWQSRLDDVRSAGGKFVALTPEKPGEAARTIEKGQLAYTVLSDPRHEAAKAFNVRFVVDDATRKKYLEFGLDVGKANASGTWELPAPATFVIDRAGVIRYAFADWDYKKRADPDEVIRVLEALSSGG